MAAISPKISSLEAAHKTEWMSMFTDCLLHQGARRSKEHLERVFESLINERESMIGLGASLDGRLIGFAHMIVHQSAWSLQEYLYLEDVFVHAGFRGQGVGSSMMSRIFQLATARKAARLYWVVERGSRAERLYQRISEAQPLVQYRLRIPDQK